MSTLFLWDFVSLSLKISYCHFCFVVIVVLFIFMLPVLFLAAALMYSRSPQCWWILFFLLFLTHIVCPCDYSDDRHWTWSSAFLSSGPFVSAHVLFKTDPDYLTKVTVLVFISCMSSCFRVWFRDTFLFDWDTLLSFNFFFCFVLLLFYLFPCFISKLFSEFFASALSDGFSLESEWQQDSRTLLTILADLNTVWIVSTRHLISVSSCPCTNPLVTVSSTLIATGITVTFMFHRFSVFFSVFGTYLSFRVPSTLPRDQP